MIRLSQTLLARPGSSIGQTSMPFGIAVCHLWKIELLPPAKGKQKRRKAELESSGRENKVHAPFVFIFSFLPVVITIGSNW